MLASGEVFAGYVIERQLGRGGMGSVYLAKHPRLPRMTALKLLNREMFNDKEVRARFEREADLVARLDHPNIVTVYDRGLEDEQLWISMQFIDGVDAASVDPKTLPPTRAVQIVKETADALDYAHSMGVLHRDVKPANILLARSSGGRGERVYLTDFGIARLRDDTGHLTQTGTFTATLAYASPEQLTGASLDGRSDQYSLACALFWLFTGSGPFAATNPAQVIQGHLQTPPPALSSVRPGLPYVLDAVLVKAMAKRPEDRFASCSEFAAAAQAALSGRSSPAQPMVQGYQGTGPQHPISSGPHQVPGAMTGGQMTSGPMTGAPYQQVGQGPSSSGGHAMAGGPTTVNQSGYMATTAMTAQGGQAPPYTPPGSYGFAGAPGRPPAQPGKPGGKSNTGLIVAMAVGVVVLLLVGLGIVGVLASGDDTDANADGYSSTSSNTHTTVSPTPIVADSDAISREFPRMVPDDEDGDTGYNGATCGSYTSSRPSIPTEGTPDFGEWVHQWDCFGGGDAEDPFFTIYAYASPEDAQAALSYLPADTVESTDSNGGQSYTNYKFDSSGPKIVTVFTGDPDRAQFLMYTDGLAGSIDEVLRWWRSAPLN